MDHPLEAWAKENGYGRAWLAEQLSVSASTLSLWFSGDRWPKRETRLLIEELTEGAVTSLDLDKWEPPDGAA